MMKEYTGRLGTLKDNGWYGRASHSVVSESFWLHALQTIRLLCPGGILQARTLGCVAISFSRGSSWPRDQTRVSCVACRLFTVWATGEGQKAILLHTENLQVQNEIANPKKNFYAQSYLYFKLINLLIYLTVQKAMAPHSSTLALKIPWTEEPGRLQSMGLLRVGHNWTTSLSLFTFMHWRRKWQPTSVFLPGESQGQRSLVGCHLWGCTESDTTEVTYQEQGNAQNPSS